MSANSTHPFNPTSLAYSWPVRALVAALVTMLAVSSAIEPTAADDGSLSIAEPEKDSGALNRDAAATDAVAVDNDNRRREGPRLAAPNLNRAIYGHCQLDFNNESIIANMPDQAIAGFLPSSGWNERCIGDQDVNISIQPYDYPHWHLWYEDKRIGFCSQIGTYGRHADPQPDDLKELPAWVASPCTEIDPVTEPRSGIAPHAEGYTLQLFAYDLYGDMFLPITIGQLRVVVGTYELCHRSAGPTLVAAPGATDPWSCVELGAGNWNLSNTVTNAAEVRIKALTGNNTLTDIGIWTSEQ